MRGAHEDTNRFRTPATRFPVLGSVALALAFVFSVGSAMAPASALPRRAGVLTLAVDRDIQFTTFGNGIPIKLDVYEATGTDLPGVVLVHSGSFKGGDKAAQNTRTVARELQSWGLVVFAINFRLSCKPTNPPLEVLDPRLCTRAGHGTPGVGREAVEDVLAGVKWVRDNGALYRVDTTRLGIVGPSSGGSLATVAGLQGTAGQDRADAVVSWSGAMHLEIPNQGKTEPSRSRVTYIGCEYGSSQSCSADWDLNSPYHQCCDATALAGGTFFLLFNSSHEMVQRIEADQMYDRLSGTEPGNLHAAIPTTKVIVYGSGHALAYKDHVVATSGCEPACDEVDTNDAFDPTGMTVIQATAAFLLRYLPGAP
jgi:acetyl esterase/lipase